MSGNVLLERPPMADSNDPKKETVRATVSPQPSSATSAPGESRDRVRIHLPTRQPAANPLSAPADLPSPVRAAAASIAAPITIPAPKKETARITVLPNPPAKPAVQMKNAQPLIDSPKIEAPSTAVTVTPEPQFRIDQIPVPLCWALLAASVVILILQIWNYLS